MKKVLLMSMALIIGLAVVAQKPQIKNGVFVRNYQKDQKVSIEPLQSNTMTTVKAKPASLKSGDNTDIVTVLNLGTSANCLGYSSGTRPMVWADDDLNVVINFHRMGPGSTPPSLSGYLGMDLGINGGMEQADWTPQIQAYNSLMTASPYWYDAGRYPCAAIYNPTGNTTLSNAYLAFFAPNFCNMAASGFGGYGYGTMNLVNYADSSKHLRWFDSNPNTYIPDGYHVTQGGLAFMVDGGFDPISSTYVGYVTYGRGVWNATTTDFDYTYSTIDIPTFDNIGLADVKIAASPDGMKVWMTALGQMVGSTPLVDSSYAPIYLKSTDGGVTWTNPMQIQLDGPNGISGIKDHFSDYFIENFFVGPPFPTRDEIPYTTAFDHSISVDVWGNLHIGVVIGYAPGGASISTGVDSLLNVYDIYTVNDGASWQAVFMGTLKTFRGTWDTYTSDNRTYISRNKIGDKMFFTYNDTRIDGEANNQNPDVYARGFDLRLNMITSDNGVDQHNNVTFLSDITQEAYWQCTSPIVFTDNNKFTLPICTQWGAGFAADVMFKYIPDFSYAQSDFTIPTNAAPCPVGLGEKNKESVSLNVYPNPVKDIAKVTLTLTQTSNVTISVTNLVGQQVMSLNKGTMNAGSQQFSMDASNLTTGVYFVTVNVDGQKYTQKLVVE